MTAPVVKWLLNELQDTFELIKSAETAEKSRVAQIRTLAAKKFEKCYDHFTYIQKKRNLKSAVNYSDHPELVVLVADVAFKTGYQAIAREVIEDYFDERPDKGSFYCRAKQLMGLVLDYEASATNGVESIDLRKKALAEIMESVDVAQTTKNMDVRYAFIVYNSSIACWQVVQPFVREGRAKFFVDEVSKISTALEKIDDPDTNWRIKYLSAAAVCYTDAGKGKEASEALDKAIVHAEGLLNVTMEKERGIATEVAESTKVSEEYVNAMREVEEREEALAKPPRIDPDLPEGEQELPREELPPLEGLASKGYDELKELLNEAQKVKSGAEQRMKEVVEHKSAEENTLCKLYMQRVHSLPADAKKIQGLPLVTASPRMRTLINLQCMMTGAIPEKDWQGTFDAIFKDLTALPQSNAIVETLLDSNRMATRLGLDKVAAQFEEEAGKTTAVSPEIRVKTDLTKALKLVREIENDNVNSEVGQRLSAKAKEGYSINKRNEALKLLERTLAMCLTRLQDNPLVEEICVAVWNTGLPMCTPHLRENIHIAFAMACNALESILSTLVVLRTQLHLEVSKCEERADFVNKAKDEGRKALLCDYGEVEDGKNLGKELDRNRNLDHLINPYVEVLELRNDLYGSPSDVESQVNLMLQSIKESNSKRFQKDTLTKAATAIFEQLDKEKRAVEEAAREAAVEDDGETKGEDAVEETADDKYCLDKDGEFTQMSVAAIESIVSKDRTSGFTEFTRHIQRRSLILATIAQIAHGQHNFLVVQRSAEYVLSHVWDPSDKFMKHLLDRQVDMHFILADSVVERLADMWVSPEQEDALAAAEEAAMEAGEIVPNPRTLGVTSDFESEEMTQAKKVTVACLSNAVGLCKLIEDQYGLQNSVIYFWNLHLPLFRNKLYARASDEVRALLQTSLETMQALEATSAAPSISRPAQLDGKLKANIVEAIVLVAEAKGDLPAGLAAANGGAADEKVSVYDRRKLCELVGRISVLQSGGKAAEPPKLDHPLLSVYNLLAQCELPQDKFPATEAVIVTDKAAALMSGEVQTWIDGQDWPSLSKDTYNELMEMRAECWCRLTRSKISAGDIYGSQDMAEQCMGLVSQDNLQKSDARQLSPRVWRWLAICEKYFGLAIQSIISPDGMDQSLQDELSLAALRHFNISCSYSLRATREELLIQAAKGAWNASMHLVDSPASRQSLMLLQRQIIDSLLTTREENYEAAVLKQQFYLALIECLSFDRDWDAVLNLVMEAFENVSPKMQKPLWKWRVVAMSKKGKNVLDGIQNLKEGDPSLQAKVYGILARASSVPKQQLEAYKKTIEILNESIERVDYELETAQWMASAGVPRVEVIEVVQGAMDAIYEVEDKNLVETVEESKGGANDAASQHSSHSSSTTRSRAAGDKPGTGRRASATGGSRRGSRAGGSRRGSRAGATGSKRSSISGSRAGSVAEEEEDEGGRPANLHVKQLEQAVRSLSMLAMLNANDSAREEHCVEAIYFVKRFFNCWETALQLSAKSQAYWKLIPTERDETSLESFSAPVEALEGLSFPVNDPLAMLRWVPSEAFKSAMEAAKEFAPHDVPSPENLPALPLTLHYCTWLANALESYGFSKHALSVLAFARAIFTTVEVENGNCALTVLHFKAMGILCRCGLHSLIETLPDTLGASHVPCGDFVASFGAKLIDPTSAKKQERIESEQLSVFGFSSWTKALSGIEPCDCALELCGDLISLGQTSQSRALAGVAHRDYVVKQNLRGEVSMRTVLARLDSLSGKHEDVLANVLSQLESLEEVGDAQELWTQVSLAVQAYMSSARPDEAKRVCLDAIAALAEFCSIPIRKDSNKGAPPGTAQSQTIQPSTAGSVDNSVSRRSSRVSEGSNTRVVTTKTTKRGISALPQKETSLEVTAALRDAVHTYVDLLVADAAPLAREGRLLEPLYDEAVTRFSQLQELAISVSGPTSTLVASIYEKRGLVCANLLRAMHSQSSLPGRDEEEYVQWLEAQYAEANSFLAKSVDIRRGLLSRITFEEQSYLPLVAPPAKKVEEVEDPKAKGKKPAKGKEPEPEPEAMKASTQLLSIPLARDTAFAEIHLATHCLALARLRGDQLTGLPPPPTKKFTVVEEFLEATQPPEPFQDKDFRAPEIMTAASLAASAAQQLSGTELSDMGTLLHAISGVMRWCGAGSYDSRWIEAPKLEPEQEDPAEGEEGGEAAAETKEERKEEEKLEKPVPEIDASALDARATLTSAATAVVGSRHFEELKMASVSLVDAFGTLHGGACDAVPWLLFLQSLCAREWLLDTWKAALNPACEVYASLLRLNDLEAAQLPFKEAQPQIAAELSFLQASSASWRHLECSKDPAKILAQLPARTAVLSLQVCPSSKAIYACAGLPEQGAEAEAFHASGQWVVDKVMLGERDRRLLLTLVQQQRKWKEDVAKFVAVYGENVTSDQDLACVESVQAGKLGKVERALEERLRALLADLDLLLDPILGPGSRIHSLFSALCAPERGDDGEPLATQPTSLSLLTLIDSSLQDLPWEGLTTVASLFKGKVGRDFSVHLLGHRLDAHSSAATIKASEMRTVFDPYGDDVGSKIDGYERDSIADIVGKLSETCPGGRRWVPLKGTPGLLTVEDWISSTQFPRPLPDAKGTVPPKPTISLYLYAPGRFGSLLSPTELAVLDLDSVVALQVVDQGLSDAAFRRQNTLDNTKRPMDIAKEDPLSVAALTCLAGVGCYNAHLWATTLSAQKRFTEGFWRSFGSPGTSVLHALSVASLHEGAPNSGASEGGERPEAVERPSLKPWIALSRSCFGIPSLTYTDA